MKLGPVTKLGKRNKKLQKTDDNVMPTNCEVIVIFSIYRQFGTIWKPDSGRLVNKTHIFIKSNLKNLTRSENRTKSIYHSFHTIALSKGTIFAKKNADFWQKNAGISRIKRILALKGIFSETTYVCVLTYQISGFYHNSNKF